MSDPIRFTLDDVAAAVGATVAAELGRAYIRSPGAAAVTDWWLEDADDLEGERLSAVLDILAWEIAAHFESLFGWRKVA
jgi:hypothetical protein